MEVLKNNEIPEFVGDMKVGMKIKQTPIQLGIPSKDTMSRSDHVDPRNYGSFSRKSK